MSDATHSDTYDFVAELYDYVVPYRERRDVNFFVEMACDARGPVLEIGCGTGRVLIPTARQGVAIVGLDASPQMLVVCREKLSREPASVRANVEVVEGDMRAFELGRRFALVTVPFRPFQHLLTVDDQMACLNCIGRHLEADGRLVLDVFNPSLTALLDEKRLVESGEEPEVELPDGRKVLRRERVASRDFLNQVLHIELIYYVTHADGRQERLVHAFPFRYFFRFEVEHLLVRCGFTIEHVYCDYDKAPYGAKYPGELIFVGCKA